MVDWGKHIYLSVCFALFVDKREEFGNSVGLTNQGKSTEEGKKMLKGHLCNGVVSLHCPSKHGVHFFFFFYGNFFQ